MSDPRDHLQLLSIFHYAVGAMMAMVGTTPLVLVMVASALAEPGGDVVIRTDSAQVAEWLGVGLSVAIFLVALGFGIATVIAGRCLARGRRFGYCLGVAALESFFFPFGTVLGVITISVLIRPDVKALFAPAA